ncbi:exonuclease III [Nakamurella sp. UYEF19]|uniref:endonuclease/exonuclease/phosphatase family protein n=1 Tax=Nakamurella sp. UYEF19 TaxID=1756392 RepID=UPI0033952F12
MAAFNVNGIRAAVRRGFDSWLAASNADVVCLQEVRAPLEKIPPEAFAGYHLAYHEGDQPGRAGVAILSRSEPSAVRMGQYSVSGGMLRRKSVSYADELRPLDDMV